MIGNGGWAAQPTDVLLRTRARLCGGLDLVAGHIEAGTLHVIAEKRASSPAEAGHVTLGLLTSLDRELTARGINLNGA